ncbi:hypothetical protein E2C01_073649 [Portunus trituberculatus]|uniref:Uncharacterized protein n=1 Tax=Portunus trituberculatus TaxID=210409 RepID=A0A5B7IB62_PORTR|nr:hypothetical protein [Portunus trituberculatus]
MFVLAAGGPAGPTAGPEPRFTPHKGLDRLSLGGGAACQRCNTHLSTRPPVGGGCPPEGRWKGSQP